MMYRDVGSSVLVQNVRTYTANQLCRYKPPALAVGHVTPFSKEWTEKPVLKPSIQESMLSGSVKKEDITSTVSSTPSVDITIGNNTVQDLLLQQENPLELQEKLKALFSADTKTEDLFPINARELKEFVGLTGDYTHWINRMISYGFTEGTDFKVLLVEKDEQTGRGGSNRKDHKLTIDMAKEIAMIQRNSLGKLVRTYLIWAEKKLREVTVVTSQQQTVHPLTVPQTMGQVLTLAGQAIEALEQGQARQQKQISDIVTVQTKQQDQLDQVAEDLAALRRRIESYSNTSVLTEETAYNPITAEGNTTVREFSDILKGLGYDMGIIRLNNYLVENDMFQRLLQKGYKAKKKFVDLGWFINKTEDVELPSGDIIKQYKVDITPVGRQGLFLRFTGGR